jgi:anhydro-N-acetylmuramic acid kinase
MKHLSENKVSVIGTMSGTSLDGLDIVGAEFEKKETSWEYTIMAAETIDYDEEWRNRLRNAHSLPGEDLIRLHNEYGIFTGYMVNKFIKKYLFLPDLIASHGHTVFHQPQKKLTFQAGNGNYIAAESKIPVVYDFRSGDVALGGQGAPLVPVGDRLLFPEYRYCLNLGGFANISCEDNNERIAFDICPVNFVINKFTERKGIPFDKNGEMGKSGKINARLLKQLNQLDYYHQSPPKSLGREWVEETFLPTIMVPDVSEDDKLRTIYEHIAIQTGLAASGENSKMLVTGGGAFNLFLVDLIQKYSPAEIIIPSDQLINYKEALIFAFLGLLHYTGNINCYASVTGAKRDSSTGVICMP